MSSESSSRRRRSQQPASSWRRRRGSKRLRWGLLVLLALVIAFAAPAGWREASSLYREWKRDRALGQAKKFFETKEYNKALLAMQVAIRTDWENPQVWREVADMSESIGAREAIIQRQHVAMLSRGAIEDQLSLAMTALRFEDLQTASDAMKAVPAAQRDTVPYKRVATLFALREGATGVADELITSLLRTDKSDDLRFTQARLRLSNPNQTIAVAARLELAGMTQNPKLAVVALRELYADAILRGDHDAAASWGDRLVKSPEVTFTDELAVASLKIGRDPSSADALIAELKPRADRSARDAVAYATWIRGLGRAALVAPWLDALPLAIRNAPEVRVARLDFALMTKDWATAGEMLHQGAAGPLPPEMVRLAMETRAVADLVSPDERLQRWQKALDAARGDVNAFRTLYRITVVSNWEPEAEATLLAVATAFPGQTWAHEALARVYQGQKNGAGLRSILGIWQQQWPNVARLRNDWAVTDMLVDVTPSWNRAKQAAEELNTADPLNPFYATTCALAYVQAGRIPAALALVEKLKPFERRFAPRAPYLALVYAEAGRLNEARAQLDLVQPDTLLKEETRLVDLVRVKVATLEKQRAELRRLTGADAAPATPATKPTATPKP
jgi:hypothetical protein